MALIVVLMGVSGSGKTAIGQALAERLGCRFYDADDFHPALNIEKMARGLPLNDDDRVPWLLGLHDLIHSLLEKGTPAVLACSALKREYRVRLWSEGEPVFLVYLQGDFEVIQARMRGRKGHYMKAEMLQSQFDALEPPGPGEALTVDSAQSVEKIMSEILFHIPHEGSAPEGLRPPD